MELMNLCKKALIPYACPMEYAFRDELPETKIGKIDYRALEQEALRSAGGAPEEKETDNATDAPEEKETDSVADAPEEKETDSAADAPEVPAKEAPEGDDPDA